MLVPISIDQSDLLDQYLMTKSDMDDVMDYCIKEIAGAFLEKWTQVAEQSLHATRQRYVDSLFQVDSGRMSGAVVLSYANPLVKSIEEGSSPWDMKPIFEQSDKVKYNKAGGWYLTIPFKMGAPDTVGDAFGGVSALPKLVHAVLKKKVVSSDTSRSVGLTASEIPEQYRTPKTRAAISGQDSERFKAYTHKSSIYQGAFKSKDKITGDISYGSFRRVGENSDPAAFINPGIEARLLAEKAFDEFRVNLDLVATEALNTALSQYGFE